MSNFEENFQLFQGIGFSPNPSQGQLDSDIWSLIGFTDGNVAFGGVADSGSFARGNSSGGVSTGGVYSFQVAEGDFTLGIQPTGNDFTPGQILLKLQNTSESNVTEVPVSYNINYLNDQGRSNSLNLAYSLDGTNFISIEDLNFATPVAADTNGWQSVSKSKTIAGLNLAPEATFYLQWLGDDVAGSGSRDEFALNNIIVTNLAAPSGSEPPVPILKPIYEIQGSDRNSPFVGQTVIIEGIVTGDFQTGDADETRNLAGFYVQDRLGDGNAATSDGIFVSEAAFDVDVKITDKVRVTGVVSEFFGETQLRLNSVEILGNGSIAPIAVSLPTVEVIANANGSLIADLEAFEGMLVTFPQTLSVTELFNLDRFGELLVSVGGVQEQFTNFNLPNAEGNQAHLRSNASRRIMVDDGLTIQNPDPIIYPFPAITTDNPLRLGDTVTNLRGNVRFSRGSGGSGDEIYRIMPRETPTFAQGEERPETPESVGGNVKVAGLNVLNFFTTLDSSGSVTGPGNSLAPRGANNQAEFDRQLDKLITTLVAMNGDVVGLIEVENNGFAEVMAGNSTTGKTAIATIVDKLNTVLGAGTYAFVDPDLDFLGTDAIKVSLIYKTTTVGISPGTKIATLSDADLAGLGLAELAPVFNGEGTSRVPLAATFVEKASGGEFTIAVNHFKSKGSSGLSDVNDPNFDQGDGQGFWNQRRLDAATALTTWLKTDPTNSGDTDFLIIGDLNSYLKEDPITYLEDQGYTNLLNTIDSPYSYVFDGQVGSLDHALASDSLASQVTGVTEWHINADEADALDYNLDFGRNPDLFDGDQPFRVSDHDPIILGLDLEPSIADNFTLQILHTSDQEAGIPALQDAIGLSAVMNALDPLYENTLKLSSGDLFIAGPFFNASTDLYGQAGIADILIQNELGWNAAAVGNHEFDGGPGTFYNLLAPKATTQGVGIDPTKGYVGTLFPYLATNLDYSTDSSNLKNLVVPNGEAPKPNTLAGSVVVTINGEKIGVVGAVVPYLPQIANIGGITMLTDASASTLEAQSQSLAGNIQPVVDALTSQGIDKIVLMTHLQQFELEQALAPKLKNVDVLMGGGSHRVMGNSDDPLRADETQTPPQLLQPYPQIFKDAEGEDIYLINTGANYRYLGQLVLEFDAEGRIVKVGDDSGTFATDIAGVDRLYTEDITSFEQVKAKADTELVQVVDNVGTFINSLDSKIFGNTTVFLNGIRGSVRTEETNLGNLTADANLWYAEKFGFDIDISVKNGGGIRDQIGVSYIDGGTNELIQLPPQANPAVGKEEGDVSQLDIGNSLRFDNKLSVADISAKGIKDLAEYFVANWLPGATPGQFGQIGGFAFSYDPDNTAIEFTRDANGLATGLKTEGQRIQNLVLIKNDGTKEVIFQDGQLQVPANQSYKMVILEFLATGGDGYPAFYFENVVKLSELAGTNLPDQAPGLIKAGEQDALAEYLAQFHPDATKAYNQADTAIAEDTRIQNLNFRSDTILPEVTPPPEEIVSGTNGDDVLWAGRDFRGINSTVFAGAGNDEIDVPVGGEATGFNRIDAGSGADDIFVGNGDRANGGSGNDYFDASGASGYRLSGGKGNDLFKLGMSGRAIGGDGDDQFYVGEYGDNLLAGGAGADQFWLLTDDTSLIEIPNTVTDFTKGVDVIGIMNQGAGINFASLSFAGNSIALNGDTFATLTGVNTTILTAADFVFM